MASVYSDVTGLPENCKSAAERTAQALREEDRYAELPESCRKKLTELERTIAEETGESVALVAYRI